jgi:hypothetical protein
MQRTGSGSLRLTVWLLWLTLSTSSCGSSYEDTIGGVKVPIPGGMTKSQKTGIELSLPGFGGAQAAYQGKVDPEEVITFYKKEMPARGWKPTIGLLSQGGMLSYVKESTTVIVLVGKTDGGTNMTIMAGGTQR